MVKWLIAALVLLLGFLVFRLNALEARLDVLGESVARLEAADPLENLPALPVGEPRPARVIIIGADGGIPSETLAALSQRGTHVGGLGGLSGDLSTEAIREARKREDERILKVVEKDRERVIDNHLAFHKERWLESRETGLEEFSKVVHLSPVQYDRLQDLVRGEVDHMVDMLRQPRYRENPTAFVDEWDATLNETNRAVMGILTAKQREAWEEGRAYERAMYFPWLPQ